MGGGGVGGWWWRLGDSSFRNRVANPLSTMNLIFSSEFMFYLDYSFQCFSQTFLFITHTAAETDTRRVKAPKSQRDAAVSTALGLRSCYSGALRSDPEKFRHPTKRVSTCGSIGGDSEFRDAFRDRRHRPIDGIGPPPTFMGI